jgi:FkbM family methyltransferase
MSKLSSKAQNGSRRITQVHMLERLAQSLRHLPLLRQLTLLWQIARPGYDWLADRLYPQGVDWNINGTDQICISPRQRMISENHEPEVWRLLMATARHGDIVADVGAASGLYALALARRIGTTGQVVAFEPDPENYALLKQHIVLNNVATHVEAINAAVGAYSGAIRFCTGMGAYSHASSVPTKSDRQIHCITLDKVFSGRRLDLLKIDVEGYEEEVLRGSMQLLNDAARSPRLIFIELHPWAWQTVGVMTTRESLSCLLQDSGYTLATLDGRPLIQDGTYTEVVAYKHALS